MPSVGYINWTREEMFAGAGGVVDDQAPELEPIQEQIEPGQSYWENPQTLAMHYQFLNNGMNYPWGEWLEPNLLNNAYDHVKKFNEGKSSWLDWEALPNDDPFAGILRSMAIPPPEEQYQSIVSRYPEVMEYLAPPEVEPEFDLTTTGQQMTEGISPSENVMMSPETWNELPSWQRVMAGVMSSPMIQGMATMLPFAMWSMAGALAGGAVGGPVGFLVGAGTPIAMGAGLGIIGDPQSYEKLKGMGFSDEMVDKVQKLATGSLWLLNQPAEWLEKGVGATIQVAGAEDKDKLDRMLDNLPALFGAGAGTYEAYSAQYPALGNLPAGIEWLIDMGAQGETDVRFAEHGEVHVLGEAEPQPVDIYGEAALGMARNEILKGAAPIEVLQGMQETFGFSGLFTDLANQIVFDPLNVLPLASRKGISAVAKVTDNVPLQQAVAYAKGKGGVETLRLYRTALRYTDDVSKLSDISKRYAGLTPEGKFKELVPGDAPKKGFAYLNSLDPKSQTDAVTTLATDMAGLMMHTIDNVDDVEGLFRAWEILKPGEVAEIAKVLKTPAAVTVSPSLKNFIKQGLNPIMARWKGGDVHRRLLNNLADAIDDTPKNILERTKKMGGAEVIHAQLLEAAAKRGDEAASALKSDTSFNPEGIKAMLKWFDENPYDFNQFKSEVIGALDDHVTKWGVENYGVVPGKGMVRFFGGFMKSIQSIILLGLNPMYLVNNLVNNSVTAFSEGVFGFTAPMHMDAWYGKFGIEPKRAGVGFGPAGEVAATSGALQKAIKANDSVQVIQDAASGVSGKMPFLKAGGAVEAIGSKQTTYRGTKGAWQRTHHRDNYAPMPSVLYDEIVRINPELGRLGPEAVMSFIDQAMNTKELDTLGKMVDVDPGRGIETHIPEVANELGMDASDVRTVLFVGDTMSKINRARAKGASMPDAVALVEADVRKFQAERLHNDLITRAGEVPTRVKEEGFASAMQIINDMFIKREDTWMRHFAEWQRFYELTDTVRGMGGGGLDEMYKGRFAQADAEWKQQHDFEDTSWRGILAAMGFGDVKDIDSVHPDTRQFYDNTQVSRQIWQDFFKETGEMRDVFFTEQRTQNWDRLTSDTNWRILQNEFAGMYDNVAAQENVLNIRMGDTFEKMFAEQFGVDKSVGASGWWKGIADGAVTRQGFMRDFRAFLRGEPVASLKSPEVKALVAGASPKQSRKLWPKFLAEIYMPHIVENNRISADGGWRMFEDVMGRSMADLSEADQAGYFARMNEAMGEFMPEAVAVPEHTPGLLLDDTGKPMTVYHGTTKDFDRFSSEHIGSGAGRGEFGEGFYFTDDPEWAASYGGISPRDLPEGINIRPAHLEMKNPLHISPSDTSIPSKLREVLVGRYGEEVGNRIEWKEFSTTLVDKGVKRNAEYPLVIDADEASNIYKEAGYDGIIRGEVGQGAEYFVFDSDQIVSSIAEAAPEPPIAPMGPRALGTMDTVGGPRYESQINNEGWGWYVRPVLDELVRQSYLTGDAPIKADLSKLSSAGKAAMKSWLGEVKQDMTKNKLGAVQVGYHMRDMSLLNYNSRYGLDNVATPFFPYHFWFTHSMMNWAIRALDRPAFLAWMGKLAKFSDKEKDERSNLPSRLQGRYGIPQAFLPDWAGGSTWVDPLGKFFPILEFMRPLERMAQSENRFTRQAEFAVIGWARDGQITQEEAELAMTSRDGPVWERAFTQAKVEEGGRDPFDYMSMFVSPALWLTIPAKIMQGKGQEISPMPPSRTIQALATATGIEPLRMLDMEAHIRKSMGINAFGEWGDYYVDRQLSNIAAERPLETQEALLAMIDRSGPLYEEAFQRVQIEMMLRNPGAAPIYTARTGQGVGDVLGSMVFGWLPAHLLPASELKQRGLKKQYDKAWDEYNAGNKEAIGTFFDENPEYKTRLALWDEPEERLRQFLISNVWDQWHSMPKLEQKAASEQLGPVFQDQFMSSETRDYDSLDVTTLAQWAKQMGGVTPEGIEVPQGELELPPKTDSAMYQDYIAAREGAFPGITNINQAYFQAAPQTQEMIRQNTPITDYWAWNDKYIATHPELMPYVISETSKLYGVDFETANLVYQFKTARHEQWPDYYDMQNEYYAEGTSKARKREIMQRLGKAYDWEKDTIAQFPQILPYVRSAESIAKGYLKNDYRDKIDWQAQFDLSKIDPAAIRQLTNYYRSDEAITSGGMQYMQYVWENEGKPGDSLMDWIESMRVQFVGYGL